MNYDDMEEKLITKSGIPDKESIKDIYDIYSNIPKEEFMEENQNNFSSSIVTKDIVTYSILYDVIWKPISFSCMYKFDYIPDKKIDKLLLVCYTDPKYRNNGYGSKCTKSCLAYSNNMQPEPFIFALVNSNNPKAKQFIEKLNFELLPFNEQPMKMIEKDNWLWYSYYLKSLNSDRLLYQQEYLHNLRS